MRYVRLEALMICGCLAAGCGDGGRAPLGEGAAALTASATGFTAALEGCDEFVGSTLVPLDAVRARVPASYTIVEAAPGQATLLVRASRCEAVHIDGEDARPAIVAQGGVAVVSPDGTGDLNNDTLWYATDDAGLAARLRGAGFDAKLIPALSYVYTLNEASDGGALAAGALEPPALAYHLTGSMAEPAGPGFPLTANWWRDGPRGTVQMEVDIPEIRLGSADVHLSTKPGSLVGQILHGSAATFPVFSAHGRFAHATMSVELLAP